MIRTGFLVLAAVTGIAAANPRDEANIARMLAGKTAEAPRDCLTPYEANSSSVHDGLVLFRVNSKLVYRNDMRGCGSLLREDDILQTNLYGTARLCRGDIAQVIDRASHFPKGACAFGEFVPYRR